MHITVSVGDAFYRSFIELNTAENEYVQSTACLPDINATHYTQCSFIHTFLLFSRHMQMYHRLPLYIKQTFFHFSHNSTMAQFNTSIEDLIQQIRFVENHHNQMVDQYFQLKNHLNQALNNLNNEPNGEHLLIYNQYLIHSETLMKNIRQQRLTMTNLIFDLQERGISLDDESDEENLNNASSSSDEGIDEHSSTSLLDQSSKISSNNNSEFLDDEQI